MKDFKWRDLLRHHPIFSILDGKEIDELLHDELSQERDYPPDSVIIQEGEVGTSIFLIGSGSARVALTGKDGHEINLAIFRSGEFFGEMGLLQQKPRSAAVIARESCTLLEINGDHFLKLVSEHPDIEFKALLILCDRLRHVTEQVLAVNLKDVDDKLNFFNTKLDAELRVFDASMKAAQTVFDQTRLRTDEVINSAERSRTRVSFFLTTAIALLGLLGVSEVMSIKNIWKEAADIRAEQAKIQTLTADIERGEKTVEGLVKKTTDQDSVMENARQKIDANSNLISDARMRIADHIFFPKLKDALADKDEYSRAIDLYEDFRQLKSGETNVRFNRLDILIEIKKQLAQQQRPDFIDYTELLWKMTGENLTSEEKMTSYFILLTNAILLDVKTFESGKTYEVTLVEFTRFAKENKNPAIKKGIVEPLERLFDGESRERKEAFQRLKKLIAIS